MSDSIPPPGYSSESMLHGSGSAHIVAMRGGATGFAVSGKRAATLPVSGKHAATPSVPGAVPAVPAAPAAVSVTATNNASVDASKNTVDASGNIVDASKNTVDASGNTVDASGNIVDASGNTVDASRNTVDASGNTVDASGNIYEIEWEGSTYTLAKTLDEWEDEEDESLFLNFIGIPKKAFSGPGEYDEFINNLSGCVNDESSIESGCDAVNAIFKKVILMHIEDLSDQQRYGNVQKVMKIIDPESDEQPAEGATAEGETPEGKPAEGSTSQNNAAAKNTEQPPSGGKNQPVAVEKLN